MKESRKIDIHSFVKEGKVSYEQYEEEIRELLDKCTEDNCKLLGIIKEKGKVSLEQYEGEIRDLLDKYSKENFKKLGIIRARAKMGLSVSDYFGQLAAILFSAFAVIIAVISACITMFDLAKRNDAVMQFFAVVIFIFVLLCIGGPGVYYILKHQKYKRLAPDYHQIIEICDQIEKGWSKCNSEENKEGSKDGTN